MKGILCTLVLLFGLTGSSIAGQFVGFTAYTTVEFAPARGEVFEIPFQIHKAGKVTVSLYSSDGDLIRVIGAQEKLKAGNNVLKWDGKDSAGMVVPDEAYIPVLSVRFSAGKTTVLDPRVSSGGEVVEELYQKIVDARTISYRLPAPSRVLIRAGIKGGPMMRSLASWEPRAGGKNIQRWDGYDSDKLVDLRRSGKLSVLVTAFKLPNHAIITRGNNPLTYRRYRESKKWPTRSVDPKTIVLERDGVRISRHYYNPRTLETDPPVTLSLPNSLKKTAEGIPIFDKAIPITVNIPKEGRWIANQSLYEVAFFVDNEFVSEEEQGYVPLTWLWDPVGLSPGKHLLTVNISVFNGQVGVKSTFFVIPAKSD